MKIKCNIIWGTLVQLFIPLLLLWLTRFAFYFYNADVIGHIGAGRLWVLAMHGLRFDVAALAYINALFILMRFMPLKFADSHRWRVATMTVYGVANSLMLITALGDTVYFRFSNGHMQQDAFLEMFKPEMLRLIPVYFSQYWMAYVAVAALVAGMLWLAMRVEIRPWAPDTRLWKRVVILLAAALLTFLGIRGRFKGRPIGTDRAAMVVDSPREINVVLNTPFTIVRSALYSRTMPTMTFFSPEQVAALRSSVQHPEIPLEADSLRHAVAGKNLMLIVVESGSQLWIDPLNRVEGDTVKALMPFLNSLADSSLCITSLHCTASLTMVGMTNILGGIPAYGTQNWTASHYISSPIDAPAYRLADKGYDSHFLIGANPDIFSLGPLARVMGFNKVTGLADIDHTSDQANSWGIYDHLMAQQVVKTLSGLKEPFIASWLTLDLHGPFDLPKEWDTTGYRAVTSKMHRAVQYTDYSLRCFFEEARRQPWFDNTLFVITADHGCRDLTDPQYNSTYAYSLVPLILYVPDGSLPALKLSDRPMAQFDIAPTLLWLAGYDEPYVAVGTNYFDDSRPHYGLTFRNDIWYIQSSRYVVAMPQDASRVDAVYDIVADQQMLQPATDYPQTEIDNMVQWLRALLQDYTTRANSATLHLH